MIRNLKKLLGFLALALVPVLSAHGATNFSTLETQALTMTTGDYGTGIITGLNGEQFTNGTDAVIAFIFDDNAVELGDFQIKSSNAATSDNDYLQFSFWAKNDNVTPALTEFGQIVCTATDITSSTLDSTFKFNVQTAGTSTPATAATLSGANLTLGTGVGIVVPGTAAVTGATTLTGAVVTSSTLVSTGAITSRAGVSGTTGTFSGALKGMKDIVLITTDTVATAAQMNGTVFVAKAIQGDTTATLTVPTLAAGYNFAVIDADVTAGADIKIQMGTGDKVNSGTAAKAYTHGNASTAVGVAKFISIDDTDLCLDGTPSDSGNWLNNNS